jgi:hypothetical protein
MNRNLTSKYSVLYWVKIPACISFAALAAGLFINTALKDNSLDYLTNRWYAGIITVAVITYMIFIYLSVPKKITITAEGIRFFYYLTRKRIFINYQDIDKIRTVRINRVLRSATDDNYQKLEIELKNGALFNFTDDDYDNYDALKGAIYDHMWRPDEGKVLAAN